MVHWFALASWLWFLTDLEGLLWEQERAWWAGESHVLAGVTSLQCILLTTLKLLILSLFDLMRVLPFHLNKDLGGVQHSLAEKYRWLCKAHKT